MEKYRQRGVSPTKEDVHAALKGIDEGAFPGSFCKILRSPFENGSYILMHADGSGTKSSIAYLMAQETGDNQWYAGLAQDAAVMNTDDMACVGAVGPFLFSNTIGRNAHRIPGEAIKAIIHGYERFFASLKPYGIVCTMSGGETADVGDLVQTLIVDATAVATLKETEIITMRMQPGDVIVGFSSTGQALYEDKPNSGIASNGLTLARHQLLSHEYASRYPESYSPTVPQDLVYQGPYRLDDPLPESEFTIGEALLSPTRTYLPLIKEILLSFREHIHGIVHCTGGGQAKCKNFGHGLRYVKNNLFPVPPLFKAIQKTGVEWKEMYQVFNMGHRIEFYVPQEIAPSLLTIGEKYHIEGKIVGKIESSPSGKNEVILLTPYGEFVYQ
ncbi:Phosphoribosylformylglycinamidine cyclo-ligase [Brevinematales bacterium NS]|nr:phosphoribosylformylglycinamidine cyclo-ligase [Brevinematales bacterium]QJR22347.1 Phosphoribosylformylglycinamidine cyclo-ligase [Brevinematales bacterium NS]